MDAALAAARAAVADQQDEEADGSADKAAGDIRGEAVDLLLHHLLDAVDPVREAEQYDWIAARQNDDGGFPRHPGGPSDLSATVLTHIALQLAGGSADHEGLRSAARFARRHGGIEALGPEPAHLLLAATGDIDWDRTGPLLPALLPLPLPLRARAGGSDAPGGALAAAVGVLAAVRPVRELPIDTEPLHVAVSGHGGLRGAVLRTARALGRTAPRPPRRDAARILLNGQQSDGSWGGDRPHTAVCALALWTLGRGPRHPAVRAALDALARQDVLAPPAAAVDTALVLRSLAAAGERAGTDPVVDRGLDRLLPQPGDSAGRLPVLAPMAASDVDGTALVIAALHAVEAPRTGAADSAVAEGVRWLLEQRSADGGWSRHGTSHGSWQGSWNETAAPSVTAHVVAALCAEGYGWHPAVGRAVRLLLARQAIEGHWGDRSSGRLRTTGEVLLGLEAAGVRAGHLAVEGAMEWVYRQQNPDGGWSEDGEGTASSPSGPSTVAQTARCVIAAHTTGVRDVPRLDAAVAFLAQRQSDDGERPSRSIRADALALWAIALHARRSRAAAPIPLRKGGPGAVEPAEYDTWSMLWWQRRGPLAILHWCASVRAEHIPPASRPGAVLVDVACGGGLLHPHIADKGYRHIGIDVSTESAEVALRHGVDEVLIHDIHDIPLPDGCADVVVAGYCLEHVARPFDVVAECCRLLRPGGTLVMDTIADTLPARIAVITLGEGLPLSWAAPKGTHDHRAFIAPHRLVEACEANGVPVEVFGVVPVVSDLLAWTLGRGYNVRMRSGKSTKNLYGVAGVKPPA